MLVEAETSAAAVAICSAIEAGVDAPASASSTVERGSGASILVGARDRELVPRGSTHDVIRK